MFSNNETTGNFRCHTLRRLAKRVVTNFSFTQEMIKVQIDFFSIVCQRVIEENIAANIFWVMSSVYAILRQPSYISYWSLLITMTLCTDVIQGHYLSCFEITNCRKKNVFMQFVHTSIFRKQGILYPQIYHTIQRIIT